MKKNILLLGGNGFIGCRLTQRLIKDYCVHVIARTVSESDCIENIHYHANSITDSKLLREVLPKCDIVFHLATDTTPGKSALLPALEANYNLLPTLHFLEILQEYPDVFLIYISTGGAIYGDPSVELVEEKNPLVPLSYYGAGKAAIEKFIIAFCHQTGQSAMILRPSNLYGPSQRYRSGFGIIPTIFHHLLERKALSIWGDGENIRDYLYIDDFVELCLFLVERIKTIEKDVKAPIYNVGSGVGFSSNKLIEIIQNITGLKVQAEYLVARKVDVRRVVLNCDKLKKDYGWTAKTGLIEGIEKYWQALINENFLSLVLSDPRITR